MRARAVVLGFALLLVASLLQAADSRPWTKLTPQERTALAPLANTWDKMSTTQQEKLIAVAHGYPNLDPQQQRLLHARLRSWSQLSTEERQIARETYKKIHALPKADQSSIRQQWLDSLCQEFGRPASGSTSPAQ